MNWTWAAHFFSMQREIRQTRGVVLKTSVGEKSIMGAGLHWLFNSTL
jgi:hypothetical protein